MNPMETFIRTYLTDLMAHTTRMLTVQEDTLDTQRRGMNGITEYLVRLDERNRVMAEMQRLQMQQMIDLQRQYMEMQRKMVETMRSMEEYLSRSQQRDAHGYEARETSEPEHDESSIADELNGAERETEGEHELDVQPEGDQHDGEVIETDAAQPETSEGVSPDTDAEVESPVLRARQVLRLSAPESAVEAVTPPSVAQVGASMLNEMSTPSAHAGMPAVPQMSEGPEASDFAAPETQSPAATRESALAAETQVPAPVAQKQSLDRQAIADEMVSNINFESGDMDMGLGR